VDGYGAKTGQVALNWEYFLESVAARPANVAEQLEFGGLPLQLPCRFGYLQANTETLGRTFEKPAELALCFKGFRDGPISLHLFGPNNQSYGLLQKEAGSVLAFIVPVEYPAGEYYIRATQTYLSLKNVFRLSAKYSFRIIEATYPQIAVDPDVWIGQDFEVYLAGFPTYSRIALYFYRESKCAPPVPSGQRCYSYEKGYRVWTDAHGRGTYSFNFTDYTTLDPLGRHVSYLLVAQLPNQETASASFSASIPE
jgi:hypothetical protein